MPRREDAEIMAEQAVVRSNLAIVGRSASILAALFTGLIAYTFVNFSTDMKAAMAKIENKLDMSVKQLSDSVQELKTQIPAQEIRLKNAESNQDEIKRRVNRLEEKVFP